MCILFYYFGGHFQIFFYGVEISTVYIQFSSPSWQWEDYFLHFSVGGRTGPGQWPMWALGHWGQK